MSPHCNKETGHDSACLQSQIEIRHRSEDCGRRWLWAKIQDPIWKTTKLKKVGAWLKWYSQCLPNKCKAQKSNPSTVKKKSWLQILRIRYYFQHAMLNTVCMLFEKSALCRYLSPRHKYLNQWAIFLCVHFGYWPLSLNINKFALTGASKFSFPTVF
jgi:hypothetical protein